MQGFGAQPCLADSIPSGHDSTPGQTFTARLPCAGTPFNRWTFFREVEALLEHTGAVGPLTLLDLQSVIHEVCAFPLSVVKNAFTPACALSQQGAPLLSSIHAYLVLCGRCSGRCALALILNGVCLGPVLHYLAPGQSSV